MIGFLRFIGLANAAVWLGAVVFYTFAASPAVNSNAAQVLLGRNNFPVYGDALDLILLNRYFVFNLVCAVVALLHLLMEWLYQGRAPRRFWIVLVAVLFLFGLGGTASLGPKLASSQKAQFQTNLVPAQREAARRSYRIWRGFFQGLNVLLIVGTAGYFWRAANPPDELRFVGTPKFRG